MATQVGYPKNWSALSHLLKVASGWRCEACGVAHGAWGWRHDRDGSFVEVSKDVPHVRPPFTIMDNEGIPRRVIAIVLTSAHIDQTLEFGSLWDRLACWCQRCHLRHDQDQHRRNAARTRRNAMLTADLFRKD